MISPSFVRALYFRRPLSRLGYARKVNFALDAVNGMEEAITLKLPRVTVICRVTPRSIIAFSHPLLAPAVASGRTFVTFARSNDQHTRSRPIFSCSSLVSPFPPLSLLSVVADKIITAEQSARHLTIRVTDVPVDPFKSNRAGRHEVIYPRLKLFLLHSSKSSRHAYSLTRTDTRIITNRNAILSLFVVARVYRFFI